MKADFVFGAGKVFAPVFRCGQIGGGHTAEMSSRATDSLEKPNRTWRVRPWLLTLALGLGLVLTLAAESSAPARPLTGKPWQDMDYGPFLTASIDSGQPRTNLAYKGIAIRLAEAYSGRQNEAAVFDTDLLRYPVGWTGGYVALKGVVFDGEHWAYPRIDGRQVFGNPMKPGWARAGSFADPREYPYGPVPHDWAHWRGLYLHGQQVVLSYTVGSMEILEMPALENREGLTAFARVFNLGPSTSEQEIQLAFEAGRRGQMLSPNTLQPLPGIGSAARGLFVLPPPPKAVGLNPATNALDTGLLGRWEFERLAGDVAPADAGTGARLLLRGAQPVADGHAGGALSFAGEARAEIELDEAFEFLRSDLTVAAWIRTTQDGTIFCQAPPRGNWVPDGKSFFIRGGRLTFDIGWVGAVAGSRSVTDGQWHQVALTWAHSDGRVTLFVDGEPDSNGTLKPAKPVTGHTLRLGYTAPNFPQPTAFNGSLDGLRIYDRALAAEEVSALADADRLEEVLAVAAVGTPDGARWATENDGNVRLRLPAAAGASQFKVLLWRGPEASLPAFAKLVKSASPAEDLAPLTRGGPPRWPEKLATHGKPGTNDGPYAIDTLTTPDDNPWHSWLRFGGVDFFADGQRAALATWSGDVWIVSGVDGDLKNLTWQRIATGLFQPLGLKIVNDEIYVLGRDQITRLHDLNGDGEADWYENFNNDCMTSEHFHEFALDLKTDRDGNFYYIKCACHGIPASHPHHGTLLKLPPDGSKLEVVARGFRAVNGLGIGPNGEIACVDNQGYWMPANRINWVKPGGWYGNQWAWNPEGRTNCDEPLCWIHNFVDRSGGTHVWVPTDQWGPLKDQLVTVSYGMGHMFLVLKEEVEGVMQGGLTRFPLEFDTGVMRGVFHPQNHQFYAAGLYGWAGNKTLPGGFYRVCYTGKPLHLPDALHVARDGVVIGFTDPLDPQSAIDPGNYDVQVWNYIWSVNYGSPDIKPNGQEGRERLVVESATLSADRRSVFLKLPAIQPVMQMHIVFKLRAADGTEFQNFVHNTVHKLGPKPGLELLGPNATARQTETPAAPTAEAPGLIQTFAVAGRPEISDTRRARLAALYVPAGTPPTPFVPAGDFQSTWTGFLKLDLNDTITFSAEGRGVVTLRLNGETVLESKAGPLDKVASQPVPLRRGANRFELVYSSPPGGDAELRLLWSSAQRPPEPVPATVFVRDPTDAALVRGETLREGRRLLAAYRCVKCHEPEGPLPAGAMPELATDAPVLDGAGSRFDPAWLVSWLKRPRTIAPDTTMPACLSLSESDADAEARDLAAFLAEQKTATASATSSVVLKESDVSAGKALYEQLGCQACHQLPGDAKLEDDTRRPLGHVRAKWRPEALVEFLQAPAKRFAWTPMPDFRLSSAEAASLAACVLSRGDTPSAGTAGGDAERGRERFLQLGCANCHTIQDFPKPGLAARLETLAGRDWKTGCLADGPAALGAAPDFGFTGEQREALRAYLQHGLDSLRSDTPAEFAERQIRTLRCTACHARDQETDLWSRLHAAQSVGAASGQAAEDEEDGSGSAGGTVHLGRPDLTYAGEKLRADWMARLFANRLPYKARPESVGRMPGFPAYADGLATGSAHQHGLSSAPTVRPAADAALAATGEKLTHIGEGFGCVSCHDVGTQKALAGADTATINFAFVADRLRPEYFWRYIRDPQRFRPGTMMPTFIGEDGSTPIKGVLDGDATRQFGALWQYLLSLDPALANSPSDPEKTP